MSMGQKNENKSFLFDIIITKGWQSLKKKCRTFDEGIARDTTSDLLQVLEGRMTRALPNLFVDVEFYSTGVICNGGFNNSLPDRSCDCNLVRWLIIASLI